MNKKTIIIILLTLGVLLAVHRAYRVDPDTVTVRYLNQETDPAVVTVKRGWTQSFASAHPGTRVVLESAANITQRIATYVQTGAPMDVIHADGGSAAMLAATGNLLPIDDVVEALGGREAFLPGRLLIVDDKVYAINQAAAVPVLHYRKDLFEAADLDPPTTWEELLHATNRLHTDEVAGLALPGGENRATTIFAGIFLWQNCGDFFNPSLEVTIDNERTHEAMRFYAQLLRLAPPDAGAWAFTEPIESFWAGRAAMVFLWNGLDLTLRQNPALIENIGVVPMPAGRMRATEQGGRYVCVYARSAVPELAKEWVGHIFARENALRLTEIQPMLYPPATYDVLDDLRHSTAPAIEAYGDLLFDVVYPSADFAYNQIFNGGGIDPETCAIRQTGVLNPYVNVLWNSNLYARAIQRIAYEGWTPQRAASAAQEALERQVEVSRREMRAVGYD